MKIEIFTGRMIELTPSGILRAIRDGLQYRAVSPAIRREIAALLASRPLPPRFSGCDRAIVSFDFNDACAVRGVLDRRTGKDFICLLDLDITRETYAQIGRENIPRMIRDLVDVALGLCDGSRAIRASALVKAARGRGAVMDQFLAAVAAAAKSRSRDVEYELVFACSDGLGSDADLRLRHEIEEVLGAALEASEKGEVIGGSIGGGEMEVHVRLPTSRNARAMLTDMIRTNGFQPPKRISRL